MLLLSALLLYGNVSQVLGGEISGCSSSRVFPACSLGKRVRRVPTVLSGGGRSMELCPLVSSLGSILMVFPPKSCSEKHISISVRANFDVPALPCPVLGPFSFATPSGECVVGVVHLCSGGSVLFWLVPGLLGPG